MTKTERKAKEQQEMKTRQEYAAELIQAENKALKDDKKMIVVASARAEKAIRMILNVA